MTRNYIEHAQFLALQPQDVAVYLRNKGWQESGEDGAKVSYWILHRPSAEIALPLTSAWRDYAQRMADLVGILSKVEDRPATAVIEDLRQSGNDTLRIRLASPFTEDGTVPLSRGAATAGALELLVMAAACAEIKREAYYPSRKSDQATEHVRRNVRLGQTERGSYVLKVLTRVPPQLSTGQSSMLEPSQLEEPFERRVSVRLSKALDALTSAAALAGNKQSMEPMFAAVVHGVSANLCDAVLGLAGYTDDSEIELNFSWATSRPIVGEHPRNRIQIPRSSFEMLREASRVFKENAPIPEFLVSGWIVTLDSPNPEQGGVATIEAPVFGYWRKIVVNLSGSDYSLAIDAHRQSRRVDLAGELQRSGKRFSLIRPSKLTIAADDESASPTLIP